MNKCYLKSFLVGLLALGLASPAVATGLRPAQKALKGKTTRAAKLRTVRGKRGVADWSVLTYMQADNNLAPFAQFNAREMQKAAIPPSVNVILEWDKPRDGKTWRYKVGRGTLTDVGSFTGAHDLGYNPVQEVIDMSTWAKSNYDARQWCLILWNHGYGVIDPGLRALNKPLPAERLVNVPPRFPWIRIPGLHSKERGILFDDTQGTYVTNTQLGQMMQGVSAAIGQPIDIVGMDACMMAMIEIGYQIKDYARYLVASENVEPGNGWNYAGFLGHLSVDSASWTPQRLASMIVQQYGIFYQGQDNSITMSALDLNQMAALKDNVNQLVLAIAGCSRINAAQTRNLVLTARNAAIEFDITDYVDLYSFYHALAMQISRKIIRPATKGLRPGKVKVDTVFSNAAQVVQTILVNGMQLIDHAVIANTAGSAFRTVRGLSIYFPRGAADPSYKYTKFAQDTSWDDFIATY